MACMRVVWRNGMRIEFTFQLTADASCAATALRGHLDVLRGKTLPAGWSERERERLQLTRDALRSQWLFDSIAASCEMRCTCSTCSTCSVAR